MADTEQALAELPRFEHMDRVVEIDAFSLASLPYRGGDCGYSFIVPEDGKVLVVDQDQEPERLANWLFKVAAFSTIPYEPADVTDLTLEVQRLLTTEQEDFTSLMIFSDGIKRYQAALAQTGRRRRIRG